MLDYSSVKPTPILHCTVPLNRGEHRFDNPFPVMPKIAIVSLMQSLRYYGLADDEFDFFDIDLLNPSDEDILGYFRAAMPKVLGVSATVSTMYGELKRLCRLAREACPDVWIVVGGGMAVSANVILRKTEADFCIQGFGEHSWYFVAQYCRSHSRSTRPKLEELRELTGLTFLHPETGLLVFNGMPPAVKADEMVFPDYDLLRIGCKTAPEAFNNYFKPGSDYPWFAHDPRSRDTGRRPMMAALWTTKGCVGRCTFCQRSTKGYRLYDLQKMDAYLGSLASDYDVGFIQILDENFGTSREFTHKLAELMHKHGMLWVCGGVRCDSVTEQDIAYYKQMGCCGLKFGVESGSQLILDLMEKKFAIEDVANAVRWCVKHGVYSPTAVMAGYPGETDETAMATGKFLGELALMLGIPPESIGPQIFWALPLPGTPMYDYIRQIGVVDENPASEEAYLLAITDRGADKCNYINISGAPRYRQIFWDWLMRYEATRYFYAQPNPTSRAGIFPDYPVVAPASPVRIQDVFGHPRALVQYLLSTVTRLNERLCSNERVAKLPRSLVYGVMRPLTWLEYQANRTVRKILRGLGVRVDTLNIYEENGLGQHLKQECMVNMSQVRAEKRRINRSLRRIVARQIGCFPGGKPPEPFGLS